MFLLAEKMPKINLRVTLALTFVPPLSPFLLPVYTSHAPSLTFVVRHVASLGEHVVRGGERHAEGRPFGDNSERLVGVSAASQDHLGALAHLHTVPAPVLCRL